MKEGIEKRPNRMTTLLVAVVIVLAALVIYAFIIKPSVNGYVTKLQNQGANQGIIYTINTIESQLQQNGYTQLPVGNNQTIVVMTPQYCSQYMSSLLASSNSSK